MGGLDLHVIHERHLPLLVANDREAERGAADFVNIFDPPAMTLNRGRAQTNELNTPLRELGLELGECAEFGGTHGGVALWVGEENNPVFADELVEVDGAAGGFSIEVGRNATEVQRLSTLSRTHLCRVLSGNWRDKWAFCGVLARGRGLVCTNGCQVNFRASSCGLKTVRLRKC